MLLAWTTLLNRWLAGASSRLAVQRARHGVFCIVGVGLWICQCNGAGVLPAAWRARWYVPAPLLVSGRCSVAVRLQGLGLLCCRVNNMVFTQPGPPPWAAVLLCICGRCFHWADIGVHACVLGESTLGSMIDCSADVQFPIPFANLLRRVPCCVSCTYVGYYFCAFSRC